MRDALTNIASARRMDVLRGLPYHTLGASLPLRLVLRKNGVPPRGEINLGHARQPWRVTVPCSFLNVLSVWETRDRIIWCMAVLVVRETPALCCTLTGLDTCMGSIVPNSIAPNSETPSWSMYPRRACQLFRAQASFLQSDLPLHVALTRHKVSRSTVPEGRRSPPGEEGERVVSALLEHEGGCGDVDDLPAAGPGPSKTRGELVGTAEVDWR